MAAFIRNELGVSSSVGCPIVVEGRLWGGLAIHSKQSQPLPPDTESRIAQFTDLVGTAIANAESRAEVERLAAEQAALRRVATLVARERPEGEVLAVVAKEVTRLFRGQATQINRYEPDGTATSVAAVGSATPIGTHILLEDDGTATRVYRTGRPARIDAYSEVEGWFAEQAQRSGIESVVAVPIMVDRHLWGVVSCGSQESGGFPADCESRLAEFAELVATAISGLQARAELAASRARIAAAADDERRRVVRDLHDGAQQRLVHTVITLKLAQPGAGEGAEDGPPLGGDRARRAGGGRGARNSLTGSCLRSSRTAASAPASMRSAHGRRSPSRSTCRSTGSQRRSRRPPTSSSPRR